MSSILTKIRTLHIAMIMVVVAILGVFLGCSKDPIKREKTDNPQINVSLLFVYDGCKVYRFVDAGEPVYFVKCDGSFDAETIVPEHLEGKVSVPERLIQTGK